MTALGDEEIFVWCSCGKEWSMDCNPTPAGCEDHNWALQVGEDGEWGPFMTPEGYPIITIKELNNDCEQLKLEINNG